MSLESGRKLGLTASIINIIMPILTLTMYSVFIFSMLSSLSNITRGGTVLPFTNPLLSLGALWIVIIAIGIVGFIGFIMFIIGMYQLSHYYNEPGIFRNVMYSVGVGIVGGAILLVITFALLFSSIALSVGRAQSGTVSSFATFIILLLVIIITTIAIGITSALFQRRAFTKLAKTSGINNFDTAGLLILIGVVIPVVSWVGWIFAAIGFNALKPKPPPTALLYSTPHAQPVLEKIICPQCGSENSANSNFCQSCGKPLPKS